MNIYSLKSFLALASIVQLVECWPVNRKVTSSILVRAQTWVAGSVPGPGMFERQPSMFLSLSSPLFSLPSPLSKNK